MHGRGPLPRSLIGRVINPGDLDCGVATIRGAHHGTPRTTRRNLCRIGPTNHVDGIAAIVHPQTHTRTEVGPQIIRDTPGGTLCRKDQVDPKASLSLGDVDDHRARSLVTADHRSKLIDHDE